MIAKAVATESNCTFQHQRFVAKPKIAGEGEKMVRALFEVARDKAPSVILIDEIDSMLTSLKAERTRRLRDA